MLQDHFFPARRRDLHRTELDETHKKLSSVFIRHLQTTNKQDAGHERARSDLFTRDSFTVLRRPFYRKTKRFLGA